MTNAVRSSIRQLKPADAWLPSKALGIMMRRAAGSPHAVTVPCALAGRLTKSVISTPHLAHMGSPIDLTSSPDRETWTKNSRLVTHYADTNAINLVRKLHAAPCEDEGENARQRIMAFAQHHSRGIPLSSVVDLTQDTSVHEERSLQEASESAEASKAAIMSQAFQANSQGANSLLAQLAASRRARQTEAGPSPPSAGAAESSAAGRGLNLPNSVPGSVHTTSRAISILSYNIWFDDLYMEERMEAIGEIIMEQGYPTVLYLQEVTRKSFEMMKRSPWWNRYMASPGCESQSYDTAILYNKSQVSAAGAFEKHFFGNSRMGRSVLTVGISVGGASLCCATVHLESPTPGAPAAEPRREQLAQTLEVLDARPEANLVLAGDMNWTDGRDGKPKLTPGWGDVWPQLHPGDPGYSYDGSSNSMLSHSFKNRLDRVFAKLADWEPESIKMVGREAIPGLTYTKVVRGRNKQLAVLPSDHYGLLLRLRRKGSSGNNLGAT